jgi:Domain of unknown function (DUF4157)
MFRVNTFSLVLSLIVAPTITVLHQTKAQAHCRAWHLHHCTVKEVLDDVGKTVDRWGLGLTNPILAHVSSYLEYLYQQGNSKGWQRLPDNIIGTYASDYGIDLKKVRYATNINTVHGQAITIGKEIYFPRGVDFNRIEDVHWLLHELEHVRQYQVTGGVSAFLTKYIVQGSIKVATKGSFNIHDNIELEREADNKANRLIEKIQDSTSSPPPNPSSGSLASYHPGCSGDPQSPECVAAIHRACAALGAGGGMSQEVGNGVFGVACFDTKWYGDVSIGDLRSKHPGCNLENSQSPECVAAIHRFCSSSFGAGGGMSQEVGNGVFGVACFDTKWYGDVSIDDLRSKHPGCDNANKSRSSDCLAAIHRFCSSSFGAGGGMSQEVGNGVFGVACFNTKWYGDISVR